MTGRPLTLAALASAAVPGLDPATVQPSRGTEGGDFDVAFVEDRQQRRWVVRAPRTPAAGASMDLTVALLGLLQRRVPFAVPQPKGFVPVKGVGRAMVYPFLTGRPLDYAGLPGGPGLAAELGRSVAALHNLDRAVYDEAGLPAYEPDAYRERRLADLDRAAATGHVPADLLARWESRLEDVALWRFAPTPTHGNLTGDRVLAVFDDEEDAASGRVRAVLGWEAAKVADPADDFGALALACNDEAFDSVLEGYAHARVDRLDSGLETRARLAGELRLVTSLLTALGAQDQAAVDRCALALRDLGEAVAAREANHARAVAARGAPSPGTGTPSPGTGTPSPGTGAPAPRHTAGGSTVATPDPADELAATDRADDRATDRAEDRAG